MSLKNLTSSCHTGACPSAATTSTPNRRLASCEHGQAVACQLAGGTAALALQAGALPKGVGQALDGTGRHSTTHAAWMLPLTQGPTHMNQQHTAKLQQHDSSRHPAHSRTHAPAPPAPPTHLEQAIQHVGQGKVRPELLVSDAVARLLQALRPVVVVPPQQLALKALAGRVLLKLLGDGSSAGATSA